MFYCFIKISRRKRQFAIKMWAINRVRTKRKDIFYILFVPRRTNVKKRTFKVVSIWLFVLLFLSLFFPRWLENEQSWKFRSRVRDSCTAYWKPNCQWKYTKEQGSRTRHKHNRERKREKKREKSVENQQTIEQQQKKKTNEKIILTCRLWRVPKLSLSYRTCPGVASGASAWAWAHTYTLPDNRHQREKKNRNEEVTWMAPL